MPQNNNKLNIAKKEKNDEFYTQLIDIEKELKHYTKHLENKIIYCNCDNPKYSNFYKYFKDNFNNLKLKKLVATYISEDISYKTEYTDNKEIITELKGNGDFRSDECINILKQSDIIITNPPFSLFREYISLLMQYNKKFLILGNKNAITYKDIFPLIKDNKMWLGATIHSGDREFCVPKDYQLKTNNYRIDENGNRYVRVNGVRWFTNLDYNTRYNLLKLTKLYNPIDYPKYDNYDAINVDKLKDIPKDYYGVIGVPISFIDKYNPEQFEILGDSRYHDGQNFDINYINSKCLYRRILIKKIKK